MVKKVTTIGVEKREEGLYRVMDSDKPLNFIITPAHHKAALESASGGCSCPTECVIAQALDQAIPGGFSKVEVGARITKITCEATMTIVRYSTPAVLKSALQLFDKTKQWDLPPGTYKLYPLDKSLRMDTKRSRWHTKKKEKTGVKSSFRCRAIPTRRISKLPSNVCS